MLGNGIKFEHLWEIRKAAPKETQNLASVATRDKLSQIEDSRWIVCQGRVEWWRGFIRVGGKALWEIRSAVPPENVDIDIALASSTPMCSVTRCCDYTSKSNVSQNDQQTYFYPARERFDVHIHSPLQ